MKGGSPETLELDESGDEIRGELKGQWVRLCLFAIIIEIPLFAFIIYETLRGPFPLVQTALVIAFAALADLGLSWLVVAPIAVVVRATPSGVMVWERMLRGPPMSRTIPWADLRSLRSARYPQILVRLETSDPAAEAALSFDQVRALLRHPCCPRLSTKQEWLRKSLASPNLELCSGDAPVNEGGKLTYTF
jgi:hypothetical protein